MAKLSDIQAKLEYLDGTKYMIKEAIANKGQDILDDDVFRDFVEKINNIQTKSDFYNGGPQTNGNYDVGNTIIVVRQKGSTKLGDFCYITIQKDKLIDIDLSTGYTYKLGIMEAIEIEPKNDSEDNVTYKIICMLPKTYPEFISRNLNETGIIYGNEVTRDDYTWYSYEYSNLDVGADDVLNGKKFLGTTGIETGTMANNGQLLYTPKDYQQTIPAGYTTGGTIEAMDITTSDDYGRCLTLSNNILGI